MALKEEILQLRELGYSYNRIAEELKCSKGTISYYCGKGQHEKNNLRSRANRNRKRQIIEEAKSGVSCMDCSVEHPFYVMDFDHRPGETKLFNISSQLKNMTFDQLRTEMAKCDIVCSNCHRYRTWSRSLGGTTIGAASCFENSGV